MRTLLLASVAASAFLMAVSPLAQADVIALPASNGGSAGSSRGYYFTAPVDFTITGISVLQSTGTEYAEIILLPSTPPTYSSTTSNFTVLNYVSGVGSQVISVNTPVLAGQIIGVLGYDTGCGCIHYGTQPFTSSVMGMPITLARLLTQQTLTTQAASVSTESAPTSTDLGLVQLTYAVTAVPEPASLALLGMGVAGIVTTRRRRAV